MYGIGYRLVVFALTKKQNLKNKEFIIAFIDDAVIYLHNEPRIP